MRRNEMKGEGKETADVQQARVMSAGPTQLFDVNICLSAT